MSASIFIATALTVPWAGNYESGAKLWLIKEVEWQDLSEDDHV